MASPGIAAEPPSSPADRLLQTSLALLAREGLEALTLRRIAREAGVSHGAPLRHFRSLSDLLAETAAHGFRLLSESIDASSVRLPTGAGPLARLAAAGRAYVYCAVENPGLFALMFHPAYLDLTNERFREDSSEAFEQLVRHVRAAQESGWQAEHDTRLLAGVIWSAVHGLAMLYSQGALLGPVPEASLEDAVDLCLELALRENSPTPNPQKKGMP